MKETTNRKGILIPTLVGTAVGAGIALLLAPKAGRTMRKDLKRLAEDTRDKVTEVIDDGRDLYKEGRAAVARTVKAGKETYDEGTEKLEKIFLKKERSYTVPILAGGLIGASIALLLTPKAGKEVREDVKRLAENTREKVVTAIDKGIDRSKVLYAEASKAIPEALEAGKKVFAH